MWHEARKNEKKVRGIMIDFAKRAERRKAYYERLTKDPHQLIRCVGSSYKIHLDSSIAHAAESKSVMWDVRMSMDIIPEYKSDPASLPEMDFEEQRCNYERYRVLVQNRFRKLSEEAHLRQIDIEELYPTNSAATSKEEKAKLAASKAAIGYSYDEGSSSGGGTAAQAAAAAELAALISKNDSGEDSDNSNSSDDEMLRKDAPLDFENMTDAERAEVNRIGLSFGLTQFSSMAQSEVFEKRAQRVAEKHEEEMAEAFGKMTKRERRQVRDRIRKERAPTPPSYAQRNSPTYEPYDDDLCRSRSVSRSPSPECEVQFISEFGVGGGMAATRGAATPSSSTSRHFASSSSPWSQERRRGDYDRHSYISERRSPPRHSHRSRDYHHGPRYLDSHRDTTERYRHRSRSRSHERYRQHASRSRSRSPERKAASSDSGVLAAAKKLISSKSDSDKPKLTPQERLKLKMQLQLNRQLKADRKKEAIRATEREEARMKREDEIRELSQRFEERERRQQDSHRGHDDYGHRSSYRRRSRSRSPPSYRSSKYSSPHSSRY